MRIAEKDRRWLGSSARGKFCVALALFVGGVVLICLKYPDWAVAQVRAYHSVLILACHYISLLPTGINLRSIPCAHNRQAQCEHRCFDRTDAHARVVERTRGSSCERQLIERNVLHRELLLRRRFVLFAFPITPDIHSMQSLPYNANATPLSPQACRIQC